MTKRVIYADPALEAEYSAGAWAAALQAHRRTTVLAVFLLVFLPVAALVLSGVRMSEASAREAAAMVQEARNTQVLASFRELDQRVADMEDDIAPRVTASQAVTEAPAPVVITVPVPATATTSTTVAPGKAPTVTTVPTPTTTSTTAPVRACVLTICLAVG